MFYILKQSAKLNKLSITMFKLKLFLYLQLIMAVCVVSSCSMDDEDASEGANNNSLGGLYTNPDGSMTYYADFLIDVSGLKPLVNKLDFISQQEDTIKEFPTGETFFTGVKNCICNAHDRAYQIVNILFYSSQKQNSWMNFYEPYLATYTSSLDSRIKQWEVIEDQEFEGVKYNYSLKISDMPEGSGPEVSKTNALEFFYNKNFEDCGVAVFSPVNFDKVNYPEKIYGHDIMCKLFFKEYPNDSLVNELYITSMSENKNSVYFINNFYLRLRKNLKNNTIDFKALIDMPNLWFDDKTKAGYCISCVGALDDSNNSAVMHTGLVKNTLEISNAKILINDNAAGDLLTELYPSWLKLFEKEDKDKKEGNDEKENENNGEKEKLFENPAFFSSGNFSGCGAIEDKSQYLKALNSSLSVLETDFAISPLKNSIYQISW